MLIILLYCNVLWMKLAHRIPYIGIWLCLWSIEMIARELHDHVMTSIEREYISIYILSIYMVGAWRVVCHLHALMKRHDDVEHIVKSFMHNLFMHRQFNGHWNRAGNFFFRMDQLANWTKRVLNRAKYIGGKCWYNMTSQSTIVWTRLNIIIIRRCTSCIHCETRRWGPDARIRSNTICACMNFSMSCVNSATRWGNPHQSAR